MTKLLPTGPEVTQFKLDVITMGLIDPTVGIAGLSVIASDNLRENPQCFFGEPQTF